MTGQPWGRTGRVTLDECDCLYTNGLHVFLDDFQVGGVDRENWRAYVHGITILDRAESVDRAVMAILRRAAADVWRAERPVVYSVARATYPREARWWVWSGPAWPKEDHGDHECIRPIVVRTFADAIHVANFNARSLAGITS